MNCKTCGKELPDEPVHIVEVNNRPGVFDAMVYDRKHWFVGYIPPCGVKDGFEVRARAYAETNAVNLHFHYRQ